MALTDEDVRAILRLLDASAFGEMRLETDHFQLTLRRTDAGWTQELDTLQAGAPVPLSAPSPPGAPLQAGAPLLPGVPLQAGAPSPSREPAPAAPGVLQAATADAHAGQGTRWIGVTTPLPGTFYRSPKPGAAPFVEVGDRVHEHTVVAIVETMKLMNSVYAGARGTVAQICRNDAEFVAQSAVLMHIEPDPENPDRENAGGPP